MKIYTINRVDGFEEFQLTNYDEDSCYTDLLNSDKSLLNEWKELEVTVVTKGKKSDFPYIWTGMGLITISEKAKNILEGLCNKEVIEFLPIDCSGNRYYFIHIITPININFDYKLFDEEDDDKIIFDKQQVLNSDAENRLFFRGYLEENILDEITFFSEKLLKIIMQSDLKGFAYTEVWNSEEN